MASVRTRLPRIIPILLPIVCVALIAQSDPSEVEPFCEAEFLNEPAARIEALIDAGDFETVIKLINDKDSSTACIAANRLWQAHESLTPALLKQLFEEFKAIDDEQWMCSEDIHHVKMYISLCFSRVQERADASWFDYILDNEDDEFMRIFAAAWLARFDFPRGVDELTLLSSSKAYAGNVLHRNIGELAQHVLLKLNFNKEWGFDASEAQDSDEFVSKWIPWLLENRYVFLKKGKTSNQESVFPCCNRGGCG